MKIGIVGLGAMANQLAEAVLAGSGMELYALCTRNQGKLAACAARWGVARTFTDYDEMLADPALEAVMVVTPNYLHARMAIAALDAGKHVFCEKPPAVTAGEAGQMMEAARKNDRLLMYGLVFRFSPKHAFIRQLRDAGLFGEFYYGKAGIVRRAGEPGGWFGMLEYAGGGPLIDIGAHIIDLAMLCMGGFEPASVFARTFRQTENLGGVLHHGGWQAAEQFATAADVEELASLMINAKNGACLLVETSNASHISEEGMYMELLGTKGGVTVDPEIKIATVVDKVLMDMTPQVDCGQFDYGQGIVDEVQHFADCAAGKSRCIVPPEAGHTLMRVIEAAYRSAKSGQVERV